MFNYTNDQKMALEFPGNVIVSAGAGSGKTRVLVEKYFRLLVDDHPQWPVDSIVAITFTRKAAAELKSRIVDRVTKELAIEADDSPRRQRLREVRNNVGGAPIGTIHTFCGRILREFAFDANLDPDYVILEGAQEAALRMKAARETIAEIIATRDHPLYDSALQLLNLFSSSRLTTIITDMLSGRGSYLKPAARYAEETSEILFSELMVFHHAQVNRLRADFAKKWHTIIDALLKKSAGGKVFTVCESALSQWPGDSVEHWNTTAGIIELVMDQLLTKKFTCRVREFSQSGLEDFDSIRESLEELARKYSNANLSELSDDDRLDLERSKNLAGIFLHAVEVYSQLRGSREDGEAQLLDYADMELLAEKLIQSSSDVRRKLRQRYPFLIIDEFQDTSQQQWNLLGSLATDEAGQLRPNCLFVVGDKKQGVYGFRDANVTLFSHVQKLVEESNSEWNSQLGSVSMRANFRTRKAPLDFINRVFETLLTTEDNKFAVDFEALDLMRNDPPGCVEFLLSGEDEDSSEPGNNAIESGESEEENANNEAALVAAHIQHLINSEGTNPGEIAILFRKRAAFAEYESALNARNIPVVSQQGANLFLQPELEDVLAALRSIVYPHNDVTFVNYLRSAMIGFTDNLLLKISRTKGRSFYDKAVRVHAEQQYQLDDNWFGLPEVEAERLSFALDLLTNARQQIGLVPPHEIVRFILDQTGFYHSLTASWRGKQAKANMDKLLSMAREAEGLTFEDFLEYVHTEQQSVRGVGEALDLTRNDAVKIMTIHAAKGLEFPVVYLPSLNSGVSGRSGEVGTDGEEWMTLRLPKATLEKPSFLMDYFSGIDKLQQAAEERRIFYVAMTRCETRLILCANAAAKPRSETFYDWISGEFDQGRRDKRLKSSKDLLRIEAEPSEIQSVEPRPFQKLSKEARIEHALRLANSLKTPSENDAQAHPLHRKDLIIYDQILTLYLQSLVDNAIEPAMIEASELLISLIDDDELDRWVERLKAVGESVATVQSRCSSMVILPTIRLSDSNQVSTFHPHLSCNGTAVWLQLPGIDPRYFQQHTDRYNAIAGDLQGVSKAECWNIAWSGDIER